ncbi:MAG TPA: hypothetical protein VLB49_02865 [Gemmatimonadales bacterium]|nr:hypothetical protein [Gemmatimonadales bacterium]
MTKAYPVEERYGRSEVGYALRFAKESGLLSVADWTALDDQQNRARYLTWQLYRSLGAG